MPDNRDHDGSNEMKRALVIWFSCCLLTAASCDRREVATAILTAGFSRPDARFVDEAAVDNTELENVWYTGLAPQQEVQEFDQTPAMDPLDAVWHDLYELRERAAANSETLSKEAIDELLQRMEHLIAKYEKNSNSDAQLHAARDAKLTALSIGASYHPSVYSDRRDSFYRELYKAEFDSQTAASASVQRFVSEYLTQTKTNSKIGVALGQHVISHPDCEMNVQLYLTTIERLENEKQIGAAIGLATQGLTLCSSRSDVSRLEEEIHRIQAANPGLPGTTMQFTSPTLRGRRFDLTSMRGKPVLVVFWATWCPACVKETPYIKDYYERFHDEGLEIVGVSLDTDRHKLAEFVNENQLPWPQMFSSFPGNESWENAIAKHYGVRSIPQTFLLDKSGTIVAAHLQNQRQIEAAILSQLSR
ncbi:MAG: TlpA family protein disulfide reductase [Planctomycetaceae bacterium]|nr:TlpA family protein disulfide reductase [Planctomycetaceae bacterium]